MRAPSEESLVVVGAHVSHTRMLRVFKIILSIKCLKHKLQQRLSITFHKQTLGEFSAKKYLKKIKKRSNLFPTYFDSCNERLSMIGQLFPL
jgi:hypothetical protein